ncbi:MAG: hypothetical protein ABIH23_35815, partial [bacterium]
MRTYSLLLFIHVAVVSSTWADEIDVSTQTPLLEESSLGTPVVAHTLWASVVARHPEDGHPLLVTGTWSAGGDAPIFVFDHTTNSLDTVPIDAQGTYGVTPGPDGWVYIGTVSDAALYRYHLVKKELEQIGRPAPSESWLYNLLVVDDRYVLGGTYGSGRLAGFDLREKELVDFGPMNPPERYVCATAPGPEGTVYCGIGSHAELVHFDPKTGERKNLLPEKYAENVFVYDLRRDGPYLYALLLFDQRVLLFDTRTNQLVHDFGKGSALV